MTFTSFISTSLYLFAAVELVRLGLAVFTRIRTKS